MDFVNIDVEQFKKDENFIGNGTYKYNIKENKISEFYKYNSSINKEEIENLILNVNEYLLKFINNNIICLKKYRDNILA